MNKSQIQKIEDRVGRKLKYSEMELVRAVWLESLIASEHTAVIAYDCGYRSGRAETSQDVAITPLESSK